MREITFPNYESDSSALVKMYLAGQFSPAFGRCKRLCSLQLLCGGPLCQLQKDWGSFTENGGIIIADRYTTSTRCSAPSCRRSSGSFLGWLFDFEFHLLGLPAPDEVIYLQVDPAVSQKLMTQRYHGDEAGRMCTRGYRVSCPAAAAPPSIMPRTLAGPSCIAPAGTTCAASKTFRLKCGRSC